MLKNLDSRPKTKRRNKTPLFRNLPSHLEELQHIFKGKVDECQNKKIYDFIDRYNITFLQQIWITMDQTQKSKILRDFSFKMVQLGDMIVAYKHNKPIKQIFVLLQGTISYKFNYTNKYQNCYHPSKPGQVLFQPFSTQLQFQPFSYIADQPCIFLSFPMQSIITQKVISIKQKNIRQLMKCLSNYSQQQQNQQNIENLIPYMSEAFYKKNQIIFSKNTKCDFFSYIIEGEVQIAKQSKVGKDISIVQMTPGRFFFYATQKKGMQNIQIKCKSFGCRLYSIPTLILSQIPHIMTRQNLIQEKKASQLLHSAIFHKNQKVLINPLKLLKRKKRKKSKSNSKKCAQSTQQPWDLIGYMANKMKRSLESSPQIQRFTKSAHVTKRNTIIISPTRNIQLLKLRIKNRQQKENYHSLHSSTSDLYQNKIIKQSSFKLKSNYFSSVPRIIQQKVSKQNKLSLIKKTKFKLLRYAQGQNLYGISDYF